MIANPIIETNKKTKSKTYSDEVLEDLWICMVSREASLLARKEVLSGKAKFGILGDGKEVPQVAMAKAFKKGDFRSGYYRDQTFMFALGLMTVQDYFAQLYADVENDPFSGGRQMNAHFSTPLIDTEGKWTKHTELFNISADISCTAGQMARGLGLAQASKKFRNIGVKSLENMSNDGNEVVFTTIGDASTSEGVFWETMNAAAVMHVPMAVSVWDDGYGISVPVEFQTAKGSISKALEGMLINENGEGILIVTVKGHDYPELVSTYDRIINKVRKDHIPALIHVQELTQPQGHSTSGSHERYKSKERLEWEKNHDCVEVMIQWILENDLAVVKTIEDMRKEAKSYVKDCAGEAWSAYQEPFVNIKARLSGFYNQLALLDISEQASILELSNSLKSLRSIHLAELAANARQLLYIIKDYDIPVVQELKEFILEIKNSGSQMYQTHLYAQNSKAAINIPVVPKEYSDTPERLTGYQILNKYFDMLFARDDRMIAFGEDVGQIGDVNQGFAGLQEKYGKSRVFDTGIREWTIMGQAIGLAMRGWRPIAEIQYLDYLIYGLEPLSDDLSTLRYRSNGTQHAPAIIRTRGHRLEGIWHAGSPMGMLLNTLKGMYICVPRNMVQAAGMYNTLIQGDDPALVIESLNGYRIREEMPSNLGEYSIPLGTPEIIVPGSDVTLVTYGSMVRIAEKAVGRLAEMGISVELIDVQTILPFDLEHSIVKSLEKTNRIIFMDEDVEGGGTSFMLQQVLEVQNGYRFLDSAPLTLHAHEHRTPFGTDGDYFTKPNEEDIIEKVYNLMTEVDPSRFPSLF